MDRVKQRKVLYILHEDDHQAMKEVRADPFGLLRILRLFEQVHFCRTIQGLLQYTAADVFLQS